MSRRMDWGSARVLVTGATGFVGTNLVERLVQEGSQVFVYARPTASVRPPELTRSVHMLHGDIEDPAALQRAVRQAQPDFVFHLASTPFNPPPPDPGQHLRVIGVGTRNLLAALPDGADVRIVHTGSAAEYGSGCQLTEDSPLRPATELGVAKATATLLMQAYARLRHLHTVSLRLFTPYGPWEAPTRLVPHVVLSAVRGHDVAISTGQQQRDFIFISDVVDALLLAARASVPCGAVYNICSGHGLAVREVAATILRLMGDPVKLLVGALPTRPDEIWELSGCHAAAAQALGWQPKVSLSDGLSRSIDWLRRQVEAGAER